jgi:hypothetical protein
MSRPEGEKNLQGDIPRTLHGELVKWTVAHKKTPLRQCLQAMAELWIALPEPIKSVTLLCDRESPIFEAVHREIAKLLAPMARTLGFPPEMDKPMTSDEFVEGAARTLQDTAAKRGGKKGGGGSGGK